MREQATNRYWHGGRAGLEPGTILIPKSEAELSDADMTHYDLQRGYGMNVTSPERVYFSSNREFARGYAGRIQGRESETGIVFQHGALYEVEPIGEIEPDPDFKGGVSWCAPQARIISAEESNVQMDAFQVTERLGPFSAWQDGSPIYDSEGRYLPSPEQKASAGSSGALTAFEAVAPWTPVEFINASIGAQPTGDRADPNEFPGVMAQGSEAVDVMLRHRQRALGVVGLGIQFRLGRPADLDAVNGLLRLAGNTVVRPSGDDRAVIVAQHQRDGIVGAMVFTAADFDGKKAMFLDAIAVAPEWQNRGLGSVLLLTGQQTLPGRVSLAVGHCSADVAGFFAQAGYTVLRHGVNMIVPYGEEPSVLEVADGHCWFYRQGPI